MTEEEAAELWPQLNVVQQRMAVEIIRADMPNEIVENFLKTCLDPIDET